MDIKNEHLGGASGAPDSQASTMQRCRDVSADRGMKKIGVGTDGKARRVTPTNLPVLCSASMPRAPSAYPCGFTPLSLADALDAACCNVFVLRWA